MRKPISSIIIISAIIFTPTGCTLKKRQTFSKGSQITVLSIGDERVLGPLYDSSPRFMVFLPMVEYSYAEPKPALAESWEHSSDYMKWTF